MPENDLDGIVRRARAILDELPALARDPARPPRLLPVTKTQPAARVRALLPLGLTDIGENRVQEIMEKIPELGADFAIQLIGRLQTNKIKYIIDRVSMVQSLDRLELAQALDRRAREIGRRLPVLIEVNAGGERQKAGVPPEDAIGFARSCAALPGLWVRGLMTVMPRADDPETLRPLFRKTRALFEHLRDEGIDGVTADTLSMGMSGDYRVAAQEGATLLRVGSAIFGARD